MVKELGQPLPSQRTLQRHIEHCKFRPGLLVDIMDSLAVKVIVTNLSILQHYGSSDLFFVCIFCTYAGMPHNTITVFPKNG